MRLKVTGEGQIRAIELDLEGIRGRAGNLAAAGFHRVRRRWNESERRILQERTGWTPRLETTRRRYEFPVRGDRASPEMGRVSGRMHEALTTPGARGVLASAAGPGGTITFTFGPKSRGPVHYANYFSAGTGRRQAARLAVDMDNQGLGDAAGDINSYLLVGQHIGRRR